MRAHASAVILGCALVVCAARADAQSRDAAAADALFREARALMKSGDHKAACPKLLESHKLDPAAGTAINLGDCWERVGRLADALQAYRDALELMKPGDTRVAPVKAQIAVVEKRVPTLSVRLAPGAPEGARVKRDTLDLGEGSLGVALPVNPGPHWIVIVAPGRADRRQKVVISEGEHRELEVRVAPRSAEGPTEEPAREGTAVAEPARNPTAGDADGGGSSRTTWAYVAVGVGVAGIGAGLLFHQFANDEERKADGLGDGLSGDACTKPPVPAKCNEIQTALDKRDTNRTIGNASFVVGGVGLVTSVVLFLWPDDSGKDAGKSAGRHSWSLQIGSRGATLNGRF